MQINRVAIKRKSQELIHIHKPLPIYAGLIMLVLGILTSYLSARMVGMNITPAEMERYFKYVQEGNFEFAVRLLENFQPSPAATAINAALQIITSVISFGFVMFLMNIVRNTAPCLGNLLDGFGMFFKIVWLNILIYVFTTLWFTLFIIPGFIAMYRYRMAVYIMIDNPDMSALECIRESKRMMKNHKAELFVFDLSFFGWLLLASIPYLGYLVQVWTIPYMNLSYAVYYEALKNCPADAVFTEIPQSEDNSSNSEL